MKKILLFVALFCGIASYAQDYTQHNKGKIFIFWGGNRGYYPMWRLWISPKVGILTISTPLE